MMQNGFSFQLRGKKATVTKVLPIQVDGESWPITGVSFLTREQALQAKEVSANKPWSVPDDVVTVRVQGLLLDTKPHSITLPVEVKGVGRVEVSFRDTLSQDHV